MNLKAEIGAWNVKRKARLEAARNAGLENLVVMGIAKNEAMNVDEWIEHYLWQGADQIVLIDNGSTDDTIARAQAWADRGKPVTVVSRPKRSSQLQHYRSVYRELRLRRRFRWLYVADLDEFLFCPNGDRITDALAEYSTVRLIYVNWRHFGAGDQDKHPDSLRRTLCHRRATLGTHRDTKWIVRTYALKNGRGIGCHKISHVPSNHVISDNARFQLNHYITQSREFFFEVKAKRGSALTPKNDHVRTANYFRLANADCTVLDRGLADQVEGRGPTDGDRTGLCDPLLEQ